VIGSEPKGKDFYDVPDGERLQLASWVDCIRTSVPPIAPVEAGVPAAAAQLPNRALRFGRVFGWIT
jgi:hypothetical protein